MKKKANTRKPYKGPTAARQTSEEARHRLVRSAKESYRKSQGALENGSLKNFSLNQQISGASHQNSPLPSNQLAVPLIRIGKHQIGPGCPVFVIAELSGNHSQSFDAAVKLVHLAKAAGADAIKLQTYTADTITIRSDEEWFRIDGGTLWDGRMLYELYQESFTPWEWQPKLQTVARELGLELFSSAFDPAAVDFLEQMQVPAHKIASPELVDIPLIQKMARTGKPLLLSTGMASLAEIEEAVTAARAAGAAEICLLKCTSSYPAPPEHANLRTMSDLAARFKVPVGLSDHTLSSETAIAAVALGACIIEKHFTESRATPGPDSAFSLEPDEFREMVDAIRTAERSLASVQYGATPSEIAMLKFRRSLFVVSDVKAGEMFTEQNVRSIRPSHGLHTRHLADVLGRRATREVCRGTPLTWDMIAAADDSAHNGGKAGPTEGKTRIAKVLKKTAGAGS